MDENLARKIGAAVRVARGRRGVTQEEAAEAISVTPEFFARIERGVTFPSVPTLVRLVAALNASADELLGRTSESEGEMREASSATLNLGEPSDLSPSLRRLLKSARKLKPRELRLLNLTAATLTRCK